MQIHSIHSNVLSGSVWHLLSHQTPFLHILTITAFPVLTPPYTRYCPQTDRSLQMARMAGFEPTTPRSVIWCSIQLSYIRIWNFFSYTQMARMVGVEPTTPRTGIWCSIQLSYIRISKWWSSRGSNPRTRFHRPYLYHSRHASKKNADNFQRSISALPTPMC